MQSGTKSRRSLAFQKTGTQSVLSQAQNGLLLESSITAESRVIQQKTLQFNPQNKDLIYSIGNFVEGIKANIHYRLDVKEKKLYCVKIFHKNQQSDYLQERDKYQELREQFGHDFNTFGIMMESFDNQDYSIYFKQGLCTLDQFTKKRCEYNIQWEKDELIYVFTRMIDFVFYMFDKKYFHGDLKPQNIVLDPISEDINNNSNNQSNNDEGLVNKKLELKVIDFSGATQNFQFQQFYTPVYFNSYKNVQNLISTMPKFNSIEERFQNEIYTVFRVFQSTCVYSQKQSLDIQQKFRLKTGYIFQSKENLLEVQYYIQDKIFANYYQNEQDFRLLMDFMRTKIINFDFNMEDIKNLIQQMNNLRQQQLQCPQYSKNFSFNNNNFVQEKSNDYKFSKKCNLSNNTNNPNSNNTTQENNRNNHTAHTFYEQGLDDKDMICEKIISDMKRSFIKKAHVNYAEYVVDPLQQLLIQECFITSIKCTQEHSTIKQSLFKEVSKFLQGEKKLFVLLGDSGSGKTSFLMHLQSNLNKANKICHYIRLGQFKNEQEFQHKINQIYSLYPKTEQIIFLLDGFDEIFWQQQKDLDVSISRDICGYCFENQQYKNKVILTGRKQFLRQQNRHKMKHSVDITKSMQISMGVHLSKVVIYQLCEFTSEQIEEFIQKFLEAVRQRYRYYQIQCFETDQQYYDHFQEFPELKNISKNPLTLRIILEILPQMEKNFQQSLTYKQSSRFITPRSQSDEVKSPLNNLAALHPPSPRNSNHKLPKPQQQQQQNNMNNSANNNPEKNLQGESRYVLMQANKRKMFQKYFIYQEFLDHWIKHKIENISTKEHNEINNAKIFLLNQQNLDKSCGPASHVLFLPSQSNMNTSQIIQDSHYILQEYLSKLTRILYVELNSQQIDLDQIKVFFRNHNANNSIVEYKFGAQEQNQEEQNRLKQLNFLTSLLPVQNLGKKRYSFQPKSLYDYLKANLIIQDLQFLQKKFDDSNNEQQNQYQQQQQQFQEHQNDSILRNPDFQNLTIARKLLGAQDFPQLKNVQEYFKCNEDIQLRKLLLKIISLTRDSRLQKLQHFVNLAANSATIYNIVGYSFSGLDLSQVNIQGAYLKDAIMHNCNLQEANLSDVDFTNAFLNNANLEGSILNNTKFGKYPDFISHKSTVKYIAVSNDGVYVASGSQDNCIYIWELETHKILAQYSFFKGQYNITGILFSYESQFLIISFDGKDQFGMPILCIIKNYQSQNDNDQKIIQESRYKDQYDLKKSRKIQLVQNQSLKDQEEKYYYYQNISLSENGEYFACISQYGTEIWKQSYHANEQEKFDKLYNQSWIIPEADGIHVDLTGGQENFIAVGGRGQQRVNIFSIEQRNQIHSIKDFCNTKGMLAIHPQGIEIAGIVNNLASSDYIVKIWSIIDEKIYRRLKGHFCQITCVNYCREGAGKYLLSGSIDGQVIVWNISSSEKINVFQENFKPISCLQISNFEENMTNYLFIGSEDATIKYNQLVQIVQEEDQEEREKRTGVDDQVTVLQITPKNNLIVGCRSSEQSKIFDYQSGDEISQILNPSTSTYLKKPIASINYNKKFGMMVIQDTENILICNHDTYDALYQVSVLLIDNIGNSAFSPTQPYFVYGDNSFYIRIFNLENSYNFFIAQQQQQKQQIQKNQMGETPAQSADNTPKLKNNSSNNSQNNGKSIPQQQQNNYNNKNNYLQNPIPKTKKDIQILTNVQFSNNGQYLLTYNASENRDQNPFDDSQYYDKGILKSLNNKQKNQRFSIRIWNFFQLVQEQKNACSFFTFWKKSQYLNGELKNEHTDIVKCCQFSPNDKYIASGGNDGLIVLWNFQKKNKICHFSHENLPQVLSLAFSPKNCHLVASGNSDMIYIWNVNSQNLVQILKGHFNIISQVIYSPCGNFLFSGGDDQTVRVYDVINNGNRKECHCQILKQSNKKMKGKKYLSQSSIKQNSKVQINIIDEKQHKIDEYDDGDESYSKKNNNNNIRTIKDYLHKDITNDINYEDQYLLARIITKQDLTLNLQDMKFKDAKNISQKNMLLLSQQQNYSMFQSFQMEYYYY